MCVQCSAVCACCSCLCPSPVLARLPERSWLTVRAILRQPAIQHAAVDQAVLYLQVIGLSYLPQLDLRGLPQLKCLCVYLGVDPCSELQVEFPTQLQSLELAGVLSNASWRSLGKCRGLLELDCQVTKLPGIGVDAFPQLQKLELMVVSHESVSWAATMASKSKRARLDIAADPTPLTERRFHGLQLDKLTLHLSVESTCLLWRNLSIRHLIAWRFLGDHISAETLPSGLVACHLTTTAKSLVVDLDNACLLQDFQMIVQPSCELELHGSFRESVSCGSDQLRTVHWLGHEGAPEMAFTIFSSSDHGGTEEASQALDGS